MRDIPSLIQVFGVRIRLHYTWIVAFILAIAIVVTQFSEAYPLWQRMALGVAAGLLFLTSLVIRELALNLLALNKGVPVRRVTLFVFGGVPGVSSETTNPAFELLIAVARLLSNIALAAVFWGIYLALMKAGSVLLVGIIQWLAFMFLMLALFHFLPGFPLDGGRILRALLWRTTGNYGQATLVTSWLGWTIGLLCFLGGIWLMVTTQQWLTGAVLAFGGWVLQSAAWQNHRQAVLYKALQGIAAQEIMNQECPFISPQLNLEQLVRDCILGKIQRHFIVADGAQLEGVVTMQDIKPVPKRRWSSTLVSEVMTPLSKLRTAYPQQSAAGLLEQMDDFEIASMPVLEEGEVVGIVARENLLHFGQTRAELRI